MQQGYQNVTIIIAENMMIENMILKLLEALTQSSMMLKNYIRMSLKKQELNIIIDKFVMIER